MGRVVGTGWILEKKGKNNNNKQLGDNSQGLKPEKTIVFPFLFLDINL